MQRNVRLSVIVLLAIACPVWAASPPGRKCQAAKNQESGKYAACLGKAEAALVRTLGTCSVTSATTCLGASQCPTGESCEKEQMAYQAAVAKCGEKFAGKWDALTQKAADAGAPCPDGVASTVIQDAVVDHVAEVAARLAGEVPAGTCGDGIVGAGEDCDLGTLGGGTCVTEGFEGGVLRCAVDCTFLTGGCYAPRFVDNLDGTIRDSATGLVWEKKIADDVYKNAADPHDADNSYAWSGICSDSPRPCQADVASEIACMAGVEGDASACTQCAVGEGTCLLSTESTAWQWLIALNTSQFAGHSDWRVPTRKELESLLDPTRLVGPIVREAFDGPACGAGCTDLADPSCSCTPTDEAWTATVLSGDPLMLFYLSFYDGEVMPFVPSIALNVRAVRGGF